MPKETEHIETKRSASGLSFFGKKEAKSLFASSTISAAAIFLTVLTFVSLSGMDSENHPTNIGTRAADTVLSAPLYLTSYLEQPTPNPNSIYKENNGFAVIATLPVTGFIFWFVVSFILARISQIAFKKKKGFLGYFFLWIFMAALLIFEL